MDKSPVKYQYTSHNQEGVFVNIMHNSSVNSFGFYSKIVGVLMISVLLVVVVFYFAYTNRHMYNPYLQIEDGESIVDIKFDAENHIYVAKLLNSVIERWNLDDKRIDLLFTGHSSTVTSISFNEQKNILISGSLDKSVIIWSAESGNIIKRLTEHKSAVTSVDVSLEGNIVASGDDDGVINIWETDSGIVIRTIKPLKGSIKSIGLSSNAQWLAVKEQNGGIDILQISNGDVITTIKDSYRASNLVLNSKGLLLGSGGAGTDVMMWQVPSGRQITKLEGHSAIVSALAFSPDGQFLATASGSEGNFWENVSSDPNIRIWNTSTAELLTTIHASNSLVGSLAFSSDSKWLAMGNAKGEIKIWKLSEICSNC
ncbi:MAG: hypothetical protein IPP13_24205 [Kouleothrix sp.]|nr:hypothetical protein [Kouleothrix sp.]